MENYSVRDFRDFILSKIVETRKCTRLPQHERDARADSLHEILQTELFDALYDRHDTKWLLEQAQIMRSDAQRFLRVNDAKLQATRKNLLVVQQRITELQRSLDAYNKMHAPDHDFQEREILETRRELTRDIEDAKKSEASCEEELSNASYQEDLIRILHRLEGVIMNPNYFGYLN